MGKHKSKQSLDGVKTEPLDFSINDVIEKVEAENKSKRDKRKSQKVAEVFDQSEESRDVKPKEKTHEENPRTFQSVRSHASKFATYDEYLKIMETDKRCGLVAVKEQRHFSLPYHILSGNGMAGVRYICDRTVGKYRKPLKGVVFAIGDIELIGRPIAIDEQSGFHADFLVQTIVFRPEASTYIRVTVQHLSKKFVSLTYMGAIQVKSFITPEKQVEVLGCHLELGDEVLVNLKATEVKGGLCTLIGRVTKILIRRTNRNNSNGHQRNPERKSFKFNNEPEPEPEPITETPIEGKKKRKRESAAVPELSAEIETTSETPKSKRVSLAQFQDSFSSAALEKSERKRSKKAKEDEISNGHSDVQELPGSPMKNALEEFVDITGRKRKRDREYEAPPVEATPEHVPKKKSKREKN